MNLNTDCEDSVCYYLLAAQVRIHGQGGTIRKVPLPVKRRGSSLRVYESSDPLILVNLYVFYVTIHNYPIF
jgi:hypothetical protein